MTVSKYQFIQPGLLASISDLHLVARRVVEGFMLGIHDSPRAGAGLEFSQYRSYQPGDDLRQIDWKMYARSDRFYVRESELETSIGIRFLLDSSRSMSHLEKDVSKFDYSRFLVASLAWLAHLQGDAVGLDTIGGERIHLPPRRENLHLHRLLHDLEGLEASGSWPEWETIESDLMTSSRELIVVISDFHETKQEIQEALRRLSLHHELVAFHLMGRDEISFPYQGSFRFEDLETGQSRRVDAVAVREQYLANVNRYLRSIQEWVTDYGGDYQLLTIDQPLDSALRFYLKGRRAMSGGRRPGGAPDRPQR